MKVESFLATWEECCWMGRELMHGPHLSHFDSHLKVHLFSSIVVPKSLSWPEVVGVMVVVVVVWRWK